MRFFWIVFFLISVKVAPAQEQGFTKNVVIITFDGFRWHELFAGADSANLFGNKFNTQDSAWRIKKHWAADTVQRREKLMPFFWNNFAKKRPGVWEQEIWKLCERKQPLLVLLSRLQ